MGINPGKFVCRCVLVALAATLITVASAQTGNIRSITFVSVKPDRVGDFQAEIKELHALMKKDNSTRYSSVWMSLTGPREYAIVSYYNKWSELDAGPDPATKEDAADQARLGTRLVDCAASTRRTIEEIQPDLSMPMSAEMPTMVRVLTTLVRPEKFDEYLALVKSDVLPAAQKGGRQNVHLRGSEIRRAEYPGHFSDLHGQVGRTRRADQCRKGAWQRGL